MKGQEGNFNELAEDWKPDICGKRCLTTHSNLLEPSVNKLQRLESQPSHFPALLLLGSGLDFCSANQITTNMKHMHTKREFV